MGVNYALRLLPVLFAAALLGCGATDPLEETFEQTYAIDRNSSLDLTNVDGLIQIYGAHKPGLQVKAVKRAYRSERLKAIQVNVTQTANTTTITTSFPPSKKWSFSDRSGTVDYVVVLPATCTISRAKLKNGEILLAGMDSGDVSATVQNGRIFIKNCFGNAQAKAATGTITLGYDWWWTKRFTAVAEMADGNVFATIPGAASFHMQAAAPNGKIGNDFAEQQDRTGAIITKVDAVIGDRAEATFNLTADHGDIKIMEANP